MATASEGRRLADLGELAFLEHLRSRLGASAPGAPVALGDDCAVLSPSALEWLVTTDMLVETVHFDLAYTSWFDLGYKAAAVNISDIAAMGGIPRFLVVALSLPAAVSLADLDAFYAGLRGCAEKHGVAIVGGDTSRSRDVTVGVTVIGECGPGRAVLRSGARPADVLLVTGEVGASAAGLHLLAGRAAPDISPEVRAGLARAHLRPEPRIEAGQAAARAGATAMEDVSDGVLRDCANIARRSRVRLEVDTARVPPAAGVAEVARELGLSPLQLALTGGEDFELLITIPREHLPALFRALGSGGTRLTVIGRVLPGEGVSLVGPDADLLPGFGSGWDHFRGSSPEDSAPPEEAGPGRT